MQPAFVLHRWDYQETSLLVDCFSLEDGRVRLLAKGAKRKTSSWKGVLQPFIPLNVQWGGRGELKTLTHAEAMSHNYELRSDFLYSGFYINELLQRVLPQHVAVPSLFECYPQLLQRLADKQPIETTLRWFEWQLLDELGSVFEWPQLEQRNELPETLYFRSYSGFSVDYHDSDCVTISRDQAIALGQSDWLNDPLTESQRYNLKRIMRHALAPFIGDKPLRARALFKR